jgi:hypothetical protein
MGQPPAVEPQDPFPEYIGGREPTRGSETSQYPEEEKSNEIPSVAASERGRAQTHVMSSVWALSRGGCGTDRAGP